MQNVRKYLKFNVLELGSTRTPLVCFSKYKNVGFMMTEKSQWYYAFEFSENKEMCFQDYLNYLENSTK